jgi:hypothetical protein
MTGTISVVDAAAKYVVVATNHISSVFDFARRRHEGSASPKSTPRSAFSHQCSITAVCTSDDDDGSKRSWRASSKND